MAQASSVRIAAVFSALSANFAAGRWLTPTNVYSADTVNQLKADLATASLHHGDLADYIAASAPLHCSDGWTFLARSLNCLVNGSPHQAAHFAYYAELRASMSILASRGIGIFANQHFVVDATGICKKVPQEFGTHKFAWDALDEWAQSNDSGLDLLSLFNVSGLTFAQWFQSAPGLSVVASQAATWLKEWGLDLSVLGKDHEIRNLGSYRPNELSPLSTNARDCSQFLRELWSLFEPSTGRFEFLDRELLRILVRKTYTNTGYPPSARSKFYRTHLTALFSPLGLSPQQQERFRKSFASAAPYPSLLTKAEALGLPDELTRHERVIARAALLLRVASGFATQLLNMAPLSVSNVAFWTSGIGEKSAFWSPGTPYADFIDLWQDVSDAKSDEEAWMASQPAGNISMYAWRSQRSEILRPLCECDRVGLWSVQQ